MASFKVKYLLDNSAKVYDITMPDCPPPKSIELFDHSVNPPKCGNPLPSGESVPFDTGQPKPSIFALQALLTYDVKSKVEDVLEKSNRSWLTTEFMWQSICQYSEPSTEPLDGHNLAILHSVYDELREELDVTTKIPTYKMELAFRKCSQTASPGLPWIKTAPMKNAGYIYEKNHETITYYWNRIGEGKLGLMDDTVAFAHGKIISTGEENKINLDFKFPLKQTFAESAFAQPLLAELKSQRIGKHFAFGMEIAKGGMRWLQEQLVLCTNYEPKCKILVLDCSSPGETIPAWLIRDIFKIIEEKFDFEKSVDPVTNAAQKVDSEFQKRIYAKIVDYFVKTPIRNVDGRRFQKEQGIPTGSLFSDIISMCVNFVVSRYLCKTLYFEEPYLNVFSVDDALIVMPFKADIDVPTFCNEAKSAFGMTIDQGRSFWTDNIAVVRFLGYGCYYGTPVACTSNLLASLIFPEHDRKDTEWQSRLLCALVCILSAAGNDTEVFSACTAIYRYYMACVGNLNSFLQFMDKDEKFKTFLLNLGHDHFRFNENYFFVQTMALPTNSCEKITSGVRAVDLPIEPPPVYETNQYSLLKTIVVSDTTD